MLALVLHGPSYLRLEHVPKPSVEGGGLLVEVDAAAVCASDIRIFRGEKRAKPRTVIGHELAGRIVEIGPGLEGYSLGERVTLYTVVSCGSCFYCQLGQRNMCLNRRTIGYDYDGGFAEYIHVPQEVVGLGSVIKVPEGVSMEEAALTEPLACSINGIEVLGLQLGEALLIIGAGPMGLLLASVARVVGAGKVIVSEVDEARLGKALELGADIAIDPTREELASRVRAETDGLGVDAAILTVGQPGLIDQALKAVRKQGKVNLFAGFPLGAEARIDPNLIHYGMLSVTASQNATLAQFKRALTLMGAKRLDVKPLITHRFPLEEALKAFEKKMALEGLKQIILPRLKVRVEQEEP